MTDRYDDFTGVYALMAKYFEALHHADPVKLAEIFHDDGMYVSTTPGDYLNRTIPEYLTVIEEREAPATRGEPRKEHIESIEFAGPNMAFVRLTMTMMQRRYTDFLTLYKSKGQWLVMSKIFSYTPET